VLGIEVELGPAPRGAASAVAPGFDRSWLRDARRRLFESLDVTSLRIAHLDRPAVPDVSGDLAFTFDLRSHVLFAVVDGVGSGDQATIGALCWTSSLLGILHAAKGVVWPDEVLVAADRAGLVLGKRRLTACFVGLFDSRHSELAWASAGFPTPMLRNQGRAAPLRGESVRSIESGRTKLAPDWLLLLGTDGVAHLPGRGKDVLWETRETKVLVAGARTPKELVHRLATALDRRRPKPEDDALVVAVAAP